MAKKATPTVSHEFAVERARVCSLGCHMGVAIDNRIALKTLADAKTDDWQALEQAWTQLGRYALTQAAQIRDRQ